MVNIRDKYIDSSMETELFRQALLPIDCSHCDNEFEIAPTDLDKKSKDALMLATILRREREGLKFVLEVEKLLKNHPERDQDGIILFVELRDSDSKFIREVRDIFKKYDVSLTRFNAPKWKNEVHERIGELKKQLSNHNFLCQHCGMGICYINEEFYSAVEKKVNEIFNI